MKFRCPNSTPIRVASTHGHIAIVGPEWKTLPEVLHAEALAKGCICDQQIVQAVDPTRDPYPNAANAMVTGGERALIRSALKSMLVDRMENPHEGPDEDPRFTPDNLPRVEHVSQVAGITVAREDVEAEWNVLRAEAQSVPVKPPATGAEKARKQSKAA